MRGGEGFFDGIASYFTKKSSANPPPVPPVQAAAGASGSGASGASGSGVSGATDSSMIGGKRTKSRRSRMR